MTAIVLAGGRGRRMKADKARLAVAGRTLLEHVVEQVAPFFDEVLIAISPGQKLGRPFAAGKPRRAWAGAGSSPGAARIAVVEDATPGLGPLGGILAGLKAAANEACAVVACDIPDIELPLLRGLARAAGDSEIAVPVGPSGLHEPLFAVYRKSVIPKVEALLRSGERSILPLFERCRTAIVRIDDVAWLRNLNTRRDYEYYLRTLKARRRSRRGGI